MLKQSQVFTSIANSVSLSLIQLKLSPEGNWSVTLYYDRPCLENLKDVPTKEGGGLEHNWCVHEKPQNELVVNNKIVVMLGEEDILARFERFIKVYQQVFIPQHREPSYVDMRYSHGMAVNWKS